MDRKIVTLARLKKILQRRPAKRIVFTNGCFDILHAGHVHYLEAAKEKGNILIVGLNADTSVKKIKGPHRPINSENDRARVLAGLEAVDFVVLFREETPYRLIQAIKPDVLVKGKDWPLGEIVGGDIVRACGGKVLTLPYVKNRSTTHVIRKIIQSQ